MHVRMERRFQRWKDWFKDLWDDLIDRLIIHVFYGTTTMMEFFMSGVMLLIGIWLMLPIHTFSSAGGYEVMDQVAKEILIWAHLEGKVTPEGVWGAALIFDAFVRIYGLSRNNVRWRRAAAMFAIIIWSFVSACFILSDYRFWATVLYPYYALVCIWIYIRAYR
jgi:hypothetical protein